ncbi:unnamed protein product [Eruca vesicaria subsp. sativa]|uniref:F-box associated beta-propeller type 3 domain-containing protein n=1 Tax=Eruca vesicaria subsp. sativa TaxID=29727 RepID=A0ABC8K095_ERUVS|nr:unnamed protein product [Eruca vesicaria subsp. sativa]
MARYEIPNLESGYYLASGSVNGFVCFKGDVSSNRDSCPISVYNPTTRQMVKLPDVTPNGRRIYVRLGYDPVEDQYKVLCVMSFSSKKAKYNQLEEHLVCTVSSSQKQEWRKIENTTGENYYYSCVYGGICIDGALYYGVGKPRIAKFNVRSEKIEFIKTPKESLISTTLDSSFINYNGKLGGVDYCSWEEHPMTLWVLEDAEKQEWSRMTYTIPSTWRRSFLKFKGVIHTGELMVFYPWLKLSQPFSVGYYDFNKKKYKKSRDPRIDE